MASEKVMAIVEELKTLTVLELSELVHAVEDEFGVSAAAAVVAGPAVKTFGVVVGSFSLKANAEGLQNTLNNDGYNASIVKNEERNLYRVVGSSFDSKSDAVRSRDSFRAKYPDAWLLYKK